MPDKMAKNKERVSKLVLRILIPLLVIAALITGFVLLVNYVPSAKENFLIATTKIPETFTELYFEDHLALPKDIILLKENSFKFTIHNVENKDMLYPYEVYIEVNGERQSIDKSSVLIKNNEYKTIPQSFIITTPMQRAKIVVNLIDKNQPIHFWMVEE
jgi:hypothetical protein